MSKLGRDFLVGIIFVVGLTIVGVFTVVVHDVSIFTGKHQMKIVFDRVSGVAGLEKGHKVLVSGVEKGQVSSLKLKNDGAVEVLVNMDEDIKLYSDYQVAVRDTSALGGKFVDIQIGNPEEKPLQATEQGDKSLRGETQFSIFNDPNIKKITQKISDTLEKNEGTIPMLLTKPDIYNDIKAVTGNLKDITDQMKSTESTIGRILYKRELYDKVVKIADNVEKITNDVVEGKGIIGSLVNDKKLQEDVKKIVANANKTMENIKSVTKKINDGKGTVGKLVNEDKLHKDVELAIEDARKMMQEITDAVNQASKGKGTLSVLLRDEKLAGDIKAIVSNIKDVSDGLAKGEGTIGKLLKDDTVYKELRRVIKNLSDSMEDTREQVPITTFTNILFKAF